MEQLQKLIENKVGALQQNSTAQQRHKGSSKPGRQPQDHHLASQQDNIVDASVPMVFE